jgi:hypothetical protein
MPSAELRRCGTSAPREPVACLAHDPRHARLQATRDLNAAKQRSAALAAQALSARTSASSAAAQAAEASAALLAAQEAAGSVLASLHAARGVTEDSIAAMQSAAGNAPPAALGMLQRFLSDVNRVLESEALASARGAAPAGDDAATPVAPNQTASQRVCTGGEGDSESTSVLADNRCTRTEPPQTAEPLGLAARVGALQSSSAAATAPEEPRSLEGHAPASASPDAPSVAAAELALRLQTAAAAGAPLSVERDPSSGNAAQSSTADSPGSSTPASARGVGGSVSGDDVNVPASSSVSALDGAGKDQELPSEAPAQHSTRASPAGDVALPVRARSTSPFRSPRVLSVPVLTPGQSAASDPDRNRDAATEPAKQDVPKSGWMGSALSTLFGVVAVPERKPTPAAEPVAKAGAAAADLDTPPAVDPGHDAVVDMDAPRRTSLMQSKSSPSLFLVAAKAAVAAAPATPPGLEAPTQPASAAARCASPVPEPAVQAPGERSDAGGAQARACASSALACI